MSDISDKMIKYKSSDISDTIKNVEKTFPKE